MTLTRLTPDKIHRPPTLKQRLFVENYLTRADGTMWRAYQEIYGSGKAKINTVSANASKLWKQPNIQKYAELVVANYKSIYTYSLSNCLEVAAKIRDDVKNSPQVRLKANAQIVKLMNHVAPKDKGSKNTFVQHNTLTQITSGFATESQKQTLELIENPLKDRLSGDFQLNEVNHMGGEILSPENHTVGSHQAEEQGEG